MQEAFEEIHAHQDAEGDCPQSWPEDECRNYYTDCATLLENICFENEVHEGFSKLLMCK